MSVENGEWIMRGVEEDDPCCLHTVEELETHINAVGFLPLFGNEVPGFSVEERTVARYWWSEDERRDPWEWRRVIAGRGQIAYGKFFGGRAGFISREWLPVFANFRRDGYDFDALWDDELASLRAKKVMDCFQEKEELFSFELKQLAGFGKGGEKNFEGTLTDLQMRTYLCIRDFRRRKNKKGQEYGWAIAVISTPERIFGRELVAGAYREAPEASGEKILQRMRERFPGVPGERLRKAIK